MLDFPITREAEFDWQGILPAVSEYHVAEVEEVRHIGERQRR